MPGWCRSWCLVLLLLVSAGSFGAEVILVDGIAPIGEDGNLAQAREDAVRNALSEAARKSGVSVYSAAGSDQSALSFDQTTVKAATAVQRHRVVSESRDKEMYRVTIEAELAATPDTGSYPCHDGYVKRLLIGGFPLLFPEQIRARELSGFAQLTAGEMSRQFSSRSRIFVDYDGRLVVHYPEPERVVGDMPANDQALNVLRAAAEKHRAQYILLGRFRDFEVTADGGRRHLDLEALLVDGISGSLVARQRFSRYAFGDVVLPESTLFGSAAFYATGLGQGYGELLGEVAKWAEASTSCMPFSARVVKVEGKSVYVDAGVEHGIAIGDSFSAFKRQGQSVTTPKGEILGYEMTPIGDFKVRTVYPRFAIGEIVGRRSAQSLTPGDLVYAH